MGRSSSSKPAWKVGGYAAEKLIGYGASSQVWLGRVLRTGEPVALKVLAVTDAAAHRSARAEAALLSALDHPHLLRLHELVFDGNQAILVVDYAAGGSLAQLLERRSRITVGELVTAVAPVAAAVAYLHEEGLVHGDISPANLLFTAQGQPLLADLGVASMCGDTDDPHATLAYLDPAVANGSAAGAPSDVFMLAATALHALTGRPPWIASTPQELVDVAALGDIAELDDMLAGVPADVAAVVRRGLSVLPHARGTAAEFALDLRHAATPAPLELAAGQLRAVEFDSDVGVVGADAGADPDAPHQGAPQPAEGAYQPRHGAVSVSASDASARPQRAARRRSAIATDLRLERPDFARPDFSRAAATRTQDRFGQVSRETPAGRNDLDDSVDNADSAYRSTGNSDNADDAVAMSLTHQVRARVRSVPSPPSSRLRLGLRGWQIGAATVSVVAGCAGTAVVTGWRPPVLAGAAHADAAATSPAHRASTTPASTPAATTAVAGTASSTPRKPAMTAAGASPPGKSPTVTTASAASSSATSPTATTASPASAARTPAATSSAATGGPTATSPAAAPTPAPKSPPVIPTEPRPTRHTTSTAASTAAGAVDWQTVLADLDVHREHAFATADPAELAQVYTAGPLRSQDADVLRRTLRPGCTATGLRTRYRVLRSRVGSDGAVVVTAAASLATGVLRCPATPTRHTEPVPTSTLKIQLVDTSAGYRIDGLQQSAQR